MTMLSYVYASDEDIALRGSGDFSLLCPKDQKLAEGSDGAFLPSACWTITSAAVNFSACGLAPGQIVHLSKPVAHFKPPGDSLVIVSVSSDGIALRRKGQQVGIGQPPGPVTGLTGVDFAIVTLGPQIEAASYDLNRRFGIDDLVAGRRTSQLYDPREVREAVVLTVLYRQYLSMSRDAGAQRDSFASKALAFKSELDDLLDRVVIHWLPTNIRGGEDPVTTHFSTRLSR
jgi:hypothetical protein